MNKYNRNSFSATSCFYSGGIVSGTVEIPSVSPRVISVLTRSRQIRFDFSDLELIRSPHPFIYEISTPIPTVSLAL